MSTKHVVVLQYDKKWESDFKQIESELKDALDGLAIGIEHVGSTAVPGLSAKPIIDIDVVIKDYSAFDDVVSALGNIGYIHEGDLGIPGREAFKYEGKEHLQKHHLYVCPQDSDELKRHVAFRDYLCCHSDAVEEYSRIKEEGAALYPYDIDKYIEHKSPFIEGIYSKIRYDRGKELKQIFESENISFVEVSELLVDDYLTMVNDYEHVNRYIGGYIGGASEPYTREQEYEWIRKSLEDKALVFSMIEKKSGEFIGNIEFMDPDGNQAELGIALTAAKQDMGYGTEAVSAMIDYGFSQLGLKRVYLRTNLDNARAKHVYEKCGFREYDRTDKHICMEICKKHCGDRDMKNKKTVMEKLAREAFEKEVFQGTWLFAEKGEIVSKGAVGWSDPEDKIPLREDMIFDLASVSKHFTATAIMLLKRQGLLALDDDINKYYPEIPYKGITIRNLLNHTSGLPDYMEWIYKTAKAENTIPHNSVIVRFLCECGQEPLFAPGEKWEYSNTAYCLLAEIVEKVSGERFEDFLKRNIFDPAGMTTTRVYHRRKDGITIDNLAYGMVFENGKYVLPDDSPNYEYVIQLDGASGDGLVHSSVLDLFKWDRAQREETVLTKEEQAEMYTPGRLSNGEIATNSYLEGGYGFGWFTMEEPDFGLIVRHSGGWPGYHTWYERYIDDDKVLIILSCRRKDDTRGHTSFFNGMVDIGRGKEPQPIRMIEDLAVKDPDKSMWEKYCGKYERVSETIYLEEVFIRDGDLFVRYVDDMGEKIESRLYPFGENRFGTREIPVDIEFGDNSVTFAGQTAKKV